MERRALLRWFLRVFGGLVGAVVAIPVIATALSPVFRYRRDRAPLWRSVGEVDGFTVGTMHKAIVAVPRDDWTGATFELAVYVWRPTAEAVVIFSRSCTDLGCPVTYDAGSQCFFCPCHGGIFDRDGQRMAGPPPRPLYRYANRVRRGLLEIDVRSVPIVA